MPVPNLVEYLMEANSVIPFIALKNVGRDPGIDFKAYFCKSLIEKCGCRRRRQL